MSKQTVISMFSGIGGIDLAFLNAGFDIIWANEKDKYSCITYKKNLGDIHLVEDDILNVDENSIPNADVLVAGFPCQSFSVMGYKRGFKDHRGNLFFEIIRVAKKIKPRIIFLENVKNLIYHDNGKTFITIFNSLAEMGYEVKYDIENACTHGNIPQQRNRVFIIAFLDYSMLNKFTFPNKIKLTLSIDDIIKRHEKHSEIYYYNENSKYFELLNERVGRTGIYRIDDRGIAKRKYEIAPTLKANMGTYPDRVPIIRDNFGIRKITPYECLDLQGFPKNFRFIGIPLEAAYKQIGNTVCIPVVERIARNIKTVFE